MEEQYPEVPPENIRCIYLQIGELSNVQPIAMQSAFEAVIQDDVRYRNAQLNITVTAVLIYCDVCKKSSGIRDYRFVCSCGKPSKAIVQGDELLITKVEFTA